MGGWVLGVEEKGRGLRIFIEMEMVFQSLYLGAEGGVALRRCVAVR